jgi:anti-anti-sigma factor
MEQAQDIVEVIFEQLDDGPQDVILELTPVAYINSSGISVVIRMNLERNLRLVSPSPMVSDILELTGVLPFVPKFDTVEEAVASLE